jgi:hypothetical protein
VKKSNEYQVGGTHYQAEIQHWDFAAANQLDYFQGVITKYVARWRKKGGVEDLFKSLHYLEKYVEVHLGFTPVAPSSSRTTVVTVSQFGDSVGLTHQERMIVALITGWKTQSGLSDLKRAGYLITQLTQEGVEIENPPGDATPGYVDQDR